MKPRTYILFVIELDGECIIIEYNTLVSTEKKCSWLLSFLKQTECSPTHPDMAAIAVLWILMLNTYVMLNPEKINKR